MYYTNALATIESLGGMPHLWPAPPAAGSTVRLSTVKDEAEARAFLEATPVHTVNLRSLIADNGLSSPLNRGTFHGYRSAVGELEGVSLIGHATLVEARTDRAMEALAREAQACTRAHMIMGEQEKIEAFWSYYAEDGQRMRLACRELLFELCWPVQVRQEVSGLRLATLDDLDRILPAQARMAQDESGINPMEIDPEGFRSRCARRIDRGRTWVAVEDETLVFKAEVMAETTEVIYLEGIYVCPEARGKGKGLRCLSQLGQSLLGRAKTLCILVNEENTAAHAFYRKAGFKFTSVYDTIFLHQD